MRRLLFMLSMLLSVMSVLAQTIGWKNSYRENDQLSGRQLVCPQFTMTGSGLVWDISQRVETSDEDYIVEYTSADGTALTAVSVLTKCQTLCEQERHVLKESIITGDISI